MLELNTATTTTDARCVDKRRIRTKFYARCDRDIAVRAGDRGLLGAMVRALQNSGPGFGSGGHRGEGRGEDGEAECG